ncbi:unnamed protein product [Prorocentrum cordatum]|uniref:Uncharacterized protein n=1 Tax=Prorocentrum cordatum TaxID=2364126 RepID=A0ABN9Q511_9DINO|nr:unnamed protein product [Polarella glacialis]
MTRARRSPTTRRMAGTLSTMQPQLDDTKRDLEGMGERVALLEQKAEASFADAMASTDQDTMQKLDEKITKLQTQLDQPTASPLGSCAASFAGPAPGFPDVKTSKKCRVWILGFPRLMHARAMMKAGEDIKKAFPQAVSEGVSTKAYNTNKSLFLHVVRDVWESERHPGQGPRGGPPISRCGVGS